MSLDQDAFRAVLGRFASGVTVVTVLGANGRDYGMTVSAFSSVSLEPPLVMVCIGEESSLQPMIAGATHYGVSILASDQEPLSRRFAAHGERFDGIGFSRGENGMALIDGALAFMECRIVARHRAGDHTIVVGEVEAASVADARPLLYYRGGYAQLER
ncbi:MAG TPA: flavin reductase family protein [Gemmatimonadaceae bacterium]|nr:flavin reductase family protein [Gemmatimonadaceae bacterium]